MANFPIKMLNFGYQYTFCNIANSRYQYLANIADIPIADTISVQHYWQASVMRRLSPQAS